MFWVHFSCLKVTVPITSERTFMELRKIFDTIPEQFDKHRLRYSEEVFRELIGYAQLGADKKVLEIGPGTGQATDPILKTGCDYLAIELGEHLTGMMRKKYGGYSNFDIINDDFITYNFGSRKFDMIISAATIQWIPEETAFSKTFELLEPGGILAMMYIASDYRSPNEELYENIQKVYSEHFKPAHKYTHGAFKYENAVNYGYTEFNRREFFGKREMSADEYAALMGTSCDHIVIPEPHKTQLFDGIRKAVMQVGNRIVINDTFVLMTAVKPKVSVHYN